MAAEKIIRTLVGASGGGFIEAALIVPGLEGE